MGTRNAWILIVSPVFVRRGRSRDPPQWRKERNICGIMRNDESSASCHVGFYALCHFPVIYEEHFLRAYACVHPRKHSYIRVSIISSYNLRWLQVSVTPCCFLNNCLAKSSLYCLFQKLQWTIVFKYLAIFQTKVKIIVVRTSICTFSWFMYNKFRIVSYNYIFI